MPYLGAGDNFPAPGDRLAIRAHPDYLYVSFGRLRISRTVAFVCVRIIPNKTSF
jgi:hypothetical protein